MTPTNPQNNTYVTEKLDMIAQNVSSLTTKFDEFREEYIREHQKTVGAVDKAHTRIDRVEVDLLRLDKDVKDIAKLMPWVKAQSYIMTALSIPVILAAIGFVWQVITHQITIP